MVVRNIEQVPVYLRTYSVYYALTQQQRLPWTSCDLRYEFVLLHGKQWNRLFTSIFQPKNSCYVTFHLNNSDRIRKNIDCQ